MGREREAGEGAVPHNGLCSPGRLEERGLLAAVGRSAQERSLPVWISYSVYLLSSELAHAALPGIQTNLVTPPITHGVRTVPFPSPPSPRGGPWQPRVPPRAPWQQFLPQGICSPRQF